MSPRPLPTRAQAIATCVFCVVTALACAALMSAAALVPAPPAVLPGIALVCIGAPMLAAFDLLASLAVLRASSPRDDKEALSELRRVLDQIPETRHPLGL